jgi:tRNA (adenine22-N1)-methyltransferase
VKKDIILSKRMEAVVNMVSPQSLVVADIGCDHAYVSIALTQREIAQKVIAMDVRKGPLEIAARNVAEYGCGDSIELRLSDGMEKLEPGEADVIVIAGMGGLLMRNILEQGLDSLLGRVGSGQDLKVAAAEVRRPELVLQPQSDIREIRDFLQNRAYYIEKENMLIDEGKYYTVMKAVPVERQYGNGERTVPICKEEELVYGSFNLQHKDAVLLEYLQWEAKVLEGIMEKLEDTVDKLNREGHEVADTTMERLVSVREEYAVNQNALKYFQ